MAKGAQLDLLDPPKSKQLRLFRYENPLLDKFDTEFRKRIPKSPGIYIFRNLSGAVIYVGKSKNLSFRLRSYFYFAPENGSRKTLQLINQVTSIEWQITSDEKKAFLRENELIRHYQPEFNVVNKEFKTYPFQYLNLTENGIDFLLSFDEKNPAFSHVFGCFRSRRSVYRTQLAMLRLLYLVDNKVRDVFYLNKKLFKGSFGRKMTVPLKTLNSSEVFQMLRRFYEGKSNGLSTFLRDSHLNEVTDGFPSKMIEMDLETLSRFYLESSRAQKRIKKYLGFKGLTLGQSEVDDLHVNFTNSPR